MSGDEYIKTSNYFLSTGLTSLTTTLQKKFPKNVYDLLIQYYRDKKEIVKKKQKRLLAGQTQHVRYFMKLALYSIITSQEYNKTISRLKESYEILKKGMTSGGNTSSFERRENADLIAVLIQKFILNSN